MHPCIDSAAERHALVLEVTLMRSSKKPGPRVRLGRLVAALLLLTALAVAFTQSRTDMRVVEQERQRGIVQLWEALTPLRSVASFMTTGAHPDDERSNQIALMSRGMGIRNITITANRGEGGQNSMGTEYLQALGVLRSREMEQASAAFNVELFFLSESFDDPIIDFRFSKSAAETLEIWGEDVLMEKLVRAIRESRPDILFTNFLDVFGQHGNHRAVARVTVEAFHLAGDPDAYPEHLAMGLQPWQPLKLYLPAGSGGALDGTPPLEATLTVPTGGFDQFFGATYNQLGQQSRAYHRSQDMGSWGAEGPSNSTLHLLESSVTTVETDTSLLAGLADRVEDLADRVTDATLAGHIRDLQAAIDAAFDAFPDFAGVQGALQDALVSVRAARAALAGLDDADLAFDLDFRLGIKESELQYASRVALSLVTRLVAATPELTPGGSTTVTLTAYLGSEHQVEGIELGIVAPDGWTVERTGDEPATELSINQTVRATFLVTAPADAPYYNPYRRNVHPFKANGDVYGVVSYEVGGVPVTVTVDSADIIGVLPELSLRVSPENLVLNTLAGIEPLTLNVAVTNYADRSGSTTVFVDAPEGWTVEPASVDLSFAAKGDARGASFTLLPPEGVTEGSYDFGVRAEGDLASGEFVRVIEYQHVGRTYLVMPAAANLRVLEVAFYPGLRIGWVDGGSDLAFEGLRRIGMNIDLLTEDDLTTGDLSTYDSIVIGIYAYRTRPDLMAANARLLDWVERGGNLIVTYHRPADAWVPDSTPPLFLRHGGPSISARVTAADAPVVFLAPDHPIMTNPNQITDADFDGWVKERGLWFPAEWDERYTALFSITDAQWPDTIEETPYLGSMLTADIGAGRYTYTNLVLHTQLEDNVPGAYRLFANLLTPLE